MARVLAPISQTACNFLPSTGGGYWQSWTDEEAMAAYWRVKKWNLTGSVSGLANGNCSCEIIVDKSQESDLVCYTQSVSSLTSASDNITGFSADIQPDGIVVVITVEYTKFNPDTGELADCVGDFLWFPGTSGGNQVTVTLGSINKKMFAGFVAGPSFPAANTDASASVSMTAVEWWSYDGLYNTSTGQRI